MTFQRGNLNHAATRRTFPRMVGTLTHVGPLSVGRATLQPGWRWSEDVKPVVGTELCQVHHVHVLLSGRFGARLASGEEATFEPGDVFDIPPGHDAWVVGDDPVELLDISGNVGDFGLPGATARSIATLLMTDIVDSTGTLARVGDQAWRQTLADHDRVVRSELRRAHGREISTTGDGFLAEFASAAAALEAALRIRDGVGQLGIQARLGVHTGEIERVGEDVRGLAVHTTARVMSTAGPSEVLTTAITRLLCSGASLGFEPRGEHVLKGLPAPVEIFAVRATTP